MYGLFMRSDQLPAPQTNACSVLSAELGEPLAGTAATQSAWLVLEQPGPWGRDAVVESQLDPALGAELEGRTSGNGVRLALIRRPGVGQEHDPVLRRWFAASTHPDRTWLATGVVEQPTDLLRIDFALLDAGKPEAVAALEHELIDEPLLLVCTNGKRDQCCATLGRKIAVSVDALDRADRGADATPAVWEVTHLGGHKFSPTAVLLPHGYIYGRIDAARALRILGAARKGSLVMDGLRGRTTWSRAGQAAEIAVRAAIEEHGLSTVSVISVERTHPEPTPAWEVVVEVDDGRLFDVEVVGAMAFVPRAESCGKAAGTPLVLSVRTIEKIR
jgi:hypothetical protein